MILRGCNIGVVIDIIAMGFVVGGNIDNDDACRLLDAVVDSGATAVDFLGVACVVVLAHLVAVLISVEIAIIEGATSDAKEYRAECSIHRAMTNFDNLHLSHLCKVLRKVLLSWLMLVFARICPALVFLSPPRRHFGDGSRNTESCRI